MLTNNKLLFFAPNVHVGGGYVLLNQLLPELGLFDNCILWLDSRAKDKLDTSFLNENIIINWVDNNISSRMKSEFQLQKKSSKEDIVLCFHGLPPLLSNNAYVNVFFQNRIYLGGVPLSSFKFKTKVRLFIEQFICSFFKSRVDTYFVQTPSMRDNLVVWAKDKNLDIKIVPFYKIPSLVETSPQKKCSWDFIYVADGESHKNHIKLINSWKLLAQSGLYPTLVLTLSERDIILKSFVERQCKQFGLNIYDLGQLPHEDILTLYASSKALVFPSKSESFGLPLIEANHFDLPIIASELDFVRDVCVPVETFDPNSEVSIFRAISRFLNSPSLPFVPSSARSFLEEIVNENINNN